MPTTSSKVKIDAVRSYGGIVDLIDTTIQTREGRVNDLANEDPDAYISSAFDDPWVIAGNASLGHEILTLVPDVDTIVAPIGGGGLTSGLVLAAREVNGSVKIMGAEPLLGNDAYRSIKAGKLESNDDEPKTIADGARTRSLGKRNWEILGSKSGGLNDVIEVSDEQITATVRILFLKMNLKVEPTGALAVAAVLNQPERFISNRPVVCVASGGNVDPALYAKILNEEI